MSRRGDGKELKVMLPLPLHVKLHTLKVMDGQPIQTTVRDALDAYFRAREERDRQP
jgi:hypothetical protein